MLVLPSSAVGYAWIMGTILGCQNPRDELPFYVTETKLFSEEYRLFLLSRSVVWKVKELQYT